MKRKRLSDANESKIEPSEPTPIANLQVQFGALTSSNENCPDTARTGFAIDRRHSAAESTDIAGDYGKRQNFNLT